MRTARATPPFRPRPRSPSGGAIRFANVNTWFCRRLRVVSGKRGAGAVLGNIDPLVVGAAIGSVGRADACTGAELGERAAEWLAEE